MRAHPETPTPRRRSWAAVTLAAALAAPAFAADPAPTPTPIPAPAAGEDIQVPAPPFTEGIFPCSGCHADMEVNTERRELVDMHDDIVLRHGPPSRWCLDCHNPDDRDRLRLASGRTIDFAHSYELCGQCHGDKYRDWKVGVHGKRTGYWNGRKQYLLCVHCHNPHQPHFAPIAPMPPPLRPSAYGAHDGEERP